MEIRYYLYYWVLSTEPWPVLSPDAQLGSTSSRGTSRRQAIATPAPTAASHTIDAAGAAATPGPKCFEASTYASVGDLTMVSMVTVRAARSPTPLTRLRQSA